MATYAALVRSVSVRLGFGDQPQNRALLWEFVKSASGQVELDLSEKRYREYVHIPFTSDQVVIADALITDDAGAIPYSGGEGDDAYALSPEFIIGMEFAWDDQRVSWTTMMQGLPNGYSYGFSSIPAYYELRDRIYVYPKPNQEGVFRVDYESRPQVSVVGEEYDSVANTEVAADHELLLLYSVAYGKQHYHMQDAEVEFARARERLRQLKNLNIGQRIYRPQDPFEMEHNGGVVAGGTMRDIPQQ